MEPWSTPSDILACLHHTHSLVPVNGFLSLANAPAYIPRHLTSASPSIPRIFLWYSAPFCYTTIQVPPNARTTLTPDSFFVFNKKAEPATPTIVDHWAYIWLQLASLPDSCDSQQRFNINIRTSYYHSKWPAMRKLPMSQFQSQGLRKYTMPYPSMVGASEGYRAWLF